MNSSSAPSDKTPSLQSDKGTQNSNQPARSSKSPSVFSNFRFWGFIGFLVFFLAPFAYYHGIAPAFFAFLTFLEVVLLFNILIIVHELGHFLAAKWCGLKIEKFAIWFGKPLWSKTVDGVEYILGSIPAGGYVALPQMANPESIEGKSDLPREELPPASPWQKIVVAFAGPLFSFGLAIFFALFVWHFGKPVRYSESTTVIGFVLPDSPAAKAGLQPGDKIISIDGHPITHFMGMGDSVIWRIITSTADTIPIVVQRGSESRTLTASPERDIEHDHTWWQRSPPRKIGILPAMESLVIKKILPDSPALVAGLKTGDKIVGMNGQPIYYPAAISYLLKDHPTNPIQFEVITKDAGTKTFTVQPEKPISPTVIPKELPQTDIGIEEFEEDSVGLVHLNPYQQVSESVQAVVDTLGALFASHSTIGPSMLSGPVGIMNLFFAILYSEDGWKLALWFAVLINVNLALLNLLPLPVLDGGHIMLSIIEWLRRRPLSMAILEPLQTACALFLISYILYVTFFDIQDSGRMALSGIGNDEIKFAPKTSTP